MGIDLIGDIFRAGSDKTGFSRIKVNDKTSEGTAGARQKRRSIAARTSRSGLRRSGSSEGQTRGGLTIVT